MVEITDFRIDSEVTVIADIETSAIQRVLVIVAHPDDIESWAAGTVCRFVDAGRQVAFVLCTSGDKGTSDPILTPQEVGPIREAEQSEAARVMGVDEVTFLRWPDSEVEPTLVLRRELVRQVRIHKPDRIITLWGGPRSTHYFPARVMPSPSPIRS